jgi:1-acyl-sn-glycerol-3-phosphate acyltransferase
MFSCLGKYEVRMREIRSQSPQEYASVTNPIHVLEQFKAQAEAFRRRIQDTNKTDPYGMDQDMVEIARPFLRFLYYAWWRVTTQGMQHIPDTGRALLVANHSGVIPWDGAMVATSVYEEHPQTRIVRNLYMHWFSTLPVVGTTFMRLGSVPGLPENAVQLLHEDELVCAFPEGVKGVGKPFRDRYKLVRFARGGFVQAALQTRSPLIPVAIVGAEEIHPMLANSKPVAKMFGLPYFPITPTFPWLGPIGMIPLPTHWSITFCPPIMLDDYGPEDANNPLTVLNLTEQVRDTIQQTLDAKRSM